MNTKTFICAVTTLFSIVCIDSVRAEELHRMERKYGLYTGILSDPVGAVPISLAANLTSFLRANIGFAYTPDVWGSKGDFFSTGGGIKFLPMNSNLTPVLGGNFFWMHQKSDKASNPWKTDWFDRPEQNQYIFYINAGGEYQFENGFNVGVGLNSFLMKWMPFPYLNLGWFF